MRRRPVQARQRGVVLFIALIILVAMSLAGIALMRSVDTGTLIAGNLAFRQNTVQVADLGVEAARSWLLGQASATLYNDRPGNAYFATWQENLDLLGNDAANADYDWGTSASVTAAPYAPPTGYSIQYVIHRLCASSGDPTGGSAECIKLGGGAGTTASGTKGAAAYGSYPISVATNAAYRVTVRVSGPRNALSYVQVTMY